MRFAWVNVALWIAVACGGRSELDLYERDSAASGGGHAGGVLARGGSGHSAGAGGSGAIGGGGRGARGGRAQGGRSNGGTRGGGRGGLGGSAGGAGSSAGLGGVAGSTRAGAAGAALSGGADAGGVAGRALGGTAGEGGLVASAGEGGAPDCVCDSPPAPFCDDPGTLLRFGPGGHCVDGACVYDETSTYCFTYCLSDHCAPFDVSIASGENDSCAVIHGGPVKCWGGTFGGVLGDVDANYVGPTVVPGLEQGVRKVSVGTNSACALTNDGHVKCWGQYFSYAMATEVTGLPDGIVDIACGAPYFDHTCVITADATVKCWGSDNFGQLGDGTTTPSFTYQYEIADVSSLPAGAYAISAGSNDTCAITTGGQLSCWGMNRYGELGIGTYDTSPVPATVTGFATGAVAVAAGEEYSCAITTLGAVRCWGWGADGMGNVNVPLTIGGIDAATAVSVDGAACAITSGGALKCWGAGAFGQLGNGSRTSSYTTAVDVQGMSAGVVAVAVGDYHACAVMESGDVLCWGSGAGQGTSTPSLVPFWP